MNRNRKSLVPILLSLTLLLTLPGCKLIEPRGDPNEPSQIVTALHEVSAQLAATQAALAAQADPNTQAGQVAGQTAAALGTGQQLVDAAAMAAQAAVDEAAKPEPDYGPIITGTGGMIAPMTGPAAPWVLLATTILGGVVSVIQTVKRNKAQATTADIVKAIEKARVISPLGATMDQPAVKKAIAANMSATSIDAVNAIKGT